MASFKEEQQADHIVNFGAINNDSNDPRNSTAPVSNARVNVESSDSSKGGIEIDVNPAILKAIKEEQKLTRCFMIILMVLALIIIGGGSYMFFTWFEHQHKIKQQLQEQTTLKEAINTVPENFEARTSRSHENHARGEKGERRERGGRGEGKREESAFGNVMGGEAPYGPNTIVTYDDDAFEIRFTAEIDGTTLRVEMWSGAKNPEDFPDLNLEDLA